MHSPRGHFSKNGLGVLQLGVTPFAYHTWVGLKETLFAILSLSKYLLSEIYDCFLYGETLRNSGYFFPSFVSHS